MPDPALIPHRPEYYVQTGSMFENPYGVPHDEIVSMILEMPVEMAAQVVFGKYVESSGLVFSGELIQMMIDRDADHYGQAWDHTFRITGDQWWDSHVSAYAKTILDPWAKSRMFSTGIDLARQTDHTVITTLDLRTTPARLVYYRRLNRVPWDSIYLEIGRAIYRWGPSALADTTGMAGDVILSALEDQRYCPVHDRLFTSESGMCRDRNFEPLGGCDYSRVVNLGCVDGYEFGAASKKNLVDHARDCLGRGYRAGTDDPFGLIRVPPIVTIEEEHSFYAWDDKGLETDTVMSLALAMWQGLEQQIGEARVGSSY